MQNDNELIVQARKRVEVLQSVDIFSGIDIDILQKLAYSLKNGFFEKGETVFEKGDKYNAMYIISSGEVKIHDGDYVFTYFGENEFFGEYSLIDSSVRSATVTITENAELLILERIVFDKFIDENKTLALKILKSLIKRLRGNNVLEEKLNKQNKEIKINKDKIELQRKELEEVNLTKDKFFTIIAHDLKSPFNTVIGLSELLLQRYESYNNEKIKFFIEQINKHSNNTYELLENLLQWARSQTGKLLVKPEKICLYTIINKIISLYSEKTNKKGIVITNNIDTDTNVFADNNMTNAIIRNLVSNSIKFTSGNGKINISSKTSDNVVVICVSDTGIGIPEENIEKLFKIDSNISTQGTDREMGTGLGLIITKEFVEKNGGKIWVVSKENEGTSFYFTLAKG